MMKSKINYINKNLFVLLICFIFIFSEQIRTGIMGGQLGVINIIGTIILILIYINNIKKINKYGIIFIYSTISMYLLSASFYENSIFKIFKIIVIYFIPLGLILISIESETFEKIFEFTLNILKIIIICITVIGILDYVFNINFNLIISKLMSQRMQELIYNQQFSETYRLYSFMGHPLFNTELYLMFFTLSTIDYKYYKKRSLPIWILIISLIGVLLTASKTGIILMGIAMVCLFRNEKKISKIILIIGITIIVYKIGLFNSVIERFSSGSLTTGRAEKWIEVSQMGEFPIKFFTGYGNGFTFVMNTYIDWASAAFEYPFRMFSLEFGVLITSLIYIFIMIIPSIVLIKRGQWMLMLIFLIVFLDVNTFNGLSLNGDYMLIFCFFIFIILNTSNYIKLNTKEVDL